MPAWPRHHRYGRVVHAAGYRNAHAFTGAWDAATGRPAQAWRITYDLAEGATRVWVCVCTQPNIMLRQSGQRRPP